MKINQQIGLKCNKSRALINRSVKYFQSQVAITKERFPVVANYEIRAGCPWSTPKRGVKRRAHA